MSATFQWSESNLVGEVVEDGIANINFGDVDDHELTPAAYPIIAGENSYEKYIRMKFSDSFTEISNMLFWKSSGEYKTDEVIKADTTDIYATPVKTDSAVAVTTIPTPEGTAISVLADDGYDTITAPGYTQYICMQLQTSVSTPGGAVNQKEFTFQYDEV